MKEAKKIEGKNLATWEFPRHNGAGLDFKRETLRAGGEPPGLLLEWILNPMS